MDTFRARLDRLENAVSEMASTVERIERQIATARASQAERSSSSRRNDQRSWGKLKRGMSKFDVMRLLGEPGEVSTYYRSELWWYPNFPGGSVTFDSRGLLVAWRKPPGLEGSRSVKTPPAVR